MAFITGPFPIDWFGDRPTYEKLDVRVVTVGINPSLMEFGGNLNQPSLSRFPNANLNNKQSQERAFNEYFRQQPYQWFCSFEKVLNGMGASYYDNTNSVNRAIHTDLCSTEATNPVWSKLAKQDKQSLISKGLPQWKTLISALKPHVIIGALSQEMIKLLGIQKSGKVIYTINKCKNGMPRKRPVDIWLYDYNGIKFFNGITRNVPFGNISDIEKNQIGKIIKGQLP